MPFQTRLDELREIVRSDKESSKHPPAMTKLLDRQLKECGMSLLYRPMLTLPYPCRIPDAIVMSMRESLSELSVELVPIHERLVSIRRQLVALAAKDDFSKAEIKPLQEELRKIDA